MTEQNLHDYNKWLMEVWNPNQLYIPFAIDAPKAFLDYQAEQLTLTDVVKQSEQLLFTQEEIVARINEQTVLNGETFRNYFDKK